jgi:hypothetical protein
VNFFLDTPNLGLVTNVQQLNCKAESRSSFLPGQHQATASQASQRRGCRRLHQRGRLAFAAGDPRFGLSGNLCRCSAYDHRRP